MRQGSWFDSYGTNAQYMRRFARRYVVQSGRQIRYASAEEFLADLIATGFVKKVSDAPNK